MKEILQIKITLEGIRPKIWRRVLVPSNISFFELHNIIQKVMGWKNSHLYEIQINDFAISPEEEGYNLAESSFHKLSKSPEFMKMLEQENTSKGQAALNTDKINKILNEMEKNKPKDKFNIKTPISRLINTEKQRFHYLYDFGDNWEHTLVVEKIMDKKEFQVIPICLDGERACPPEDCGSIPGYYELMEIRQDKSHPEFEERIVEWLGEDYDPEQFDIDQTNKQLMVNSGRARWIKKD